jgi:hypothetical protein
MMSFLAAVFSALNTVSNAVFSVVFGPAAWLSGWLSLTLISAVLGVVVFIIFMYTANRAAFSRVVDTILASILAVFLFRDNIGVTMRSEARLLASSVRLLWYSLFPVMIMSLPLIFVLAQMAALYQFRAPVPGSETVLVTMQLQEQQGEWPEISLALNEAVGVVSGPVRLFSRSEVYWELLPLEAGEHDLSFLVGGQTYDKTFSAGAGFIPLSPLRPGAGDLLDTLLFPLEKPLSGQGAVRSIQIDYPDRISKIYGTDWWLLYFCIISMIFALLSKPFIKIRG